VLSTSGRNNLVALISSHKMATEEVVAREVMLLQREVKRLGLKAEATGKYVVAFGVLFDATVDIFEALAGTLKAAKRKGVINYAAPILLKGSHDKVPITLLTELTAEEEAGLVTAGH
jgi:Costars